MLAADEDALICDLAETYNIFDYRAVPVEMLARLSAGLRPDSRIKLILSGSSAPAGEILLAGIVDRLSQLVWLQSEDGVKGRNRPPSVLDILLGEQPASKGEDNGPVVTFSTAAEYEAAMAAAKQRAGGDALGH